MFCATVIWSPHHHLTLQLAIIMMRTVVAVCFALISSGLGAKCVTATYHLAGIVVADGGQPIGASHVEASWLVRGREEGPIHVPVSELAHSRFL